MNLQSYNLNREIEALVAARTASNVPWTRDDLPFLNQYTGYGGMGKFSKELESADESKRILYEYYTPVSVVEKMVALAYKHGYQPGGPVLEPSCGTGRFLHYFSPETPITAIEMDATSAAIARANFPRAKVLHQTFNELFADRASKAKAAKAEFDLVIGNPPYGVFDGRFTKGEKELTKATTYPEYFITRSLDVTRSGGLVNFIVPSAFLDGAMNDCKKNILGKSELVDAYRMPNKIFDATDIGTDIVIFKKK